MPVNVLKIVIVFDLWIKKEIKIEKIEIQVYIEVRI